VGVHEVRALQVGAAEPGLLQVGVMEVRTPQISRPQVKSVAIALRRREAVTANHCEARLHVRSAHR
jgi:hypothetical protein